MKDINESFAELKDRLEVKSEIDAQAIFWLYKILLHRAPESLQPIKHFLSNYRSVEAVRDTIRQSEEYMNLHKVEFPHQYYIPESSSASFKRSAKKLCLAAIVMNEESAIENMLRSCAPILDHIVIIDTGSTDRTIDVARNTLAELKIESTFANVKFEDFSQARNAALERVPPEMHWVLMLDADEEIVPQDLARFVPLLEAPEDIDGWQLPRMTFSEKTRRMPLSPYPDFQMRLFRNRMVDPIRFRGRVHEKPYNVRQWGFAPINRCERGETGGPHIHHLGYMDISHEKFQSKHRLYQELTKDPSI